MSIFQIIWTQFTAVFVVYKARRPVSPSQGYTGPLVLFVENTEPTLILEYLILLRMQVSPVEVMFRHPAYLARSTVAYGMGYKSCRGTRPCYDLNLQIRPPVERN